ncbi:UNKNOWN [Stylonychia lemnae]|uniref:Uncharacterized protein n=1 Tax=Stylonychia lemnae TaxID=5949 RepID=A0A078AZP7_STYLE|nr:UNKNOWN [Stylonychia lemnae]|eukprot:CDW86278.1 UNKNOWN [Stylonychia lemnae]
MKLPLPNSMSETSCSQNQETVSITQRYQQDNFRVLQAVQSNRVHIPQLILPKNPINRNNGLIKKHQQRAVLSYIFTMQVRLMKQIEAMKFKKSDICNATLLPYIPCILPVNIEVIKKHTVQDPKQSTFKLNLSSYTNSWVQMNLLIPFSSNLFGRNGAIIMKKDSQGHLRTLY